MDRVILHVDMNSCYASIELLYHPWLRGQCVAVGGDPGQRHGIILAAEAQAKRCGVRTGMALWQARQACPQLVILPPHFDRYLRFSRLAHEIYGRYTDLQEPFGIDECWLDVTRSSIFGDGMQIAEEIRQRVRQELGITVSIGVSWNKIFAKFGSDYQKPDAITRIGRDNYRRLVWESPAEDLLGVGPATIRKLHRFGMVTAGDVALADPQLLRQVFGRIGPVLQCFARGEDRTPVSPFGTVAPVKSIGNSLTAPRDLVCEADRAAVIWLLAESVGTRLRQHGLAGQVVGISLRDASLQSFSRQRRLALPTSITEELAAAGIALCQEQRLGGTPIRSIGLRAMELVPDTVPYQLTLFADEEQRQKRRRAQSAVDEIRRRFGADKVQRGVLYGDPDLCGRQVSEEGRIHPTGYFSRGNHTQGEENES